MSGARVVPCEVTSSRRRLLAEQLAPVPSHRSHTTHTALISFKMVAKHIAINYDHFGTHEDIICHHSSRSSFSPDTYASWCFGHMDTSDEIILLPLQAAVGIRMTVFLPLRSFGIFR